MRLTEYTKYGVPRWLDILYDLLEGGSFCLMMVCSLILLYAIGWAWLMPGTICLLFTVKVILEMPEEAGLLIGYGVVFTLILFVAPLLLYLVNLFK